MLPPTGAKSTKLGALRTSQEFGVFCWRRIVEADFACDISSEKDQMNLTIIISLEHLSDPLHRSPTLYTWTSQKTIVINEIKILLKVHYFLYSTAMPQVHE